MTIMYSSVHTNSMKIRYLRIGLLLIWIVPAFAQESPAIPDKPLIEVIISDADTVLGQANLLQQGFDVKVYNLDAPKQLFATFSQNLPANQVAAKRALEQRIQQYGRQALQQPLVAAYQGLSLSIQYQISRYPAVVFDQGRAVIYGVTDLEQALGLYRQWQSRLTR